MITKVNEVVCCSMSLTLDKTISSSRLCMHVTWWVSVRRCFLVKADRLLFWSWKFLVVPLHCRVHYSRPHHYSHQSGRHHSNRSQMWIIIRTHLPDITPKASSKAPQPHGPSYQNRKLVRNSNPLSAYRCHPCSGPRVDSVSHPTHGKPLLWLRLQCPGCAGLKKARLR